MNYPKHIGIIPDWNRTWAKERWLNQMIWHLQGYQRFKEIFMYTFENTPIQVVTAWWLSTENQKERTKEELGYLYDLYQQVTQDLYDMMKKHRINFRRVWSPDGLPQNLVDLFHQKQEELTFHDSEKCINLAVNYGWRDEIVRWMKNLISDGISAEEINESVISSYLDFGDLPPLDLVIRSKAADAKRLSWFLLWWVWYAELYFTPKQFPDVDVEEFQAALKWFDDIYTKRNFGK